jgi:hypothetical protein
VARRRPATWEGELGAPTKWYSMEKDHFRDDAWTSDESKFEKPEIGPIWETAVRTHFGRKLQQVFPLPSNSSEPENVRILLRKIQARFDKPPIPRDG